MRGHRAYSRMRRSDEQIGKWVFYIFAMFGAVWVLGMLATIFLPS